MGLQHLPDLQFFLDIDHTRALLQPFCANLMVHPAHRADISFHARTVLDKPRKNARIGYRAILCIQLPHKYDSCLDEMMHIPTLLYD